MKGLKFKVGMAVEVNHNKGYYPATIVEEVGFNSYLVKYTNSDTEGDSEDIVEETIDSFDIRPVPPKSKAKRFDLLVKVEAFYDLAWRAGFVTKILEHNAYVVQLKDENKERQFSHSEMRPRLRLLNGRWVCNSKETNEQSEENTSPQSKGEEHIKVEVDVTQMDIECCEAQEVELPEVTGAGLAGEERIQAGAGVTQMDIECCEAQEVELPEVTGAGPAGEEHIEAEVGVIHMDIKCCEAQGVKLPEVTGAAPAVRWTLLSEILLGRSVKLITGRKKNFCLVSYLRVL
ncbi:uncharacterized protein LOC126665180 isoform X2 [Mercurialis annua]|nr:uncharacterized protein LOC126665180 isoform X2 [Mercurialis annua]